MSPKNSLCILCYKLVSTTSIKPQSFLLLLSKYLKFLPFFEERKGQVPPEELLLCIACSKVADSFINLYSQLEAIELELRREVKSIYERTITSQYILSRTAQFQKQFECPPPHKLTQKQDRNVLQFKNIGETIQQLRNELIKHCKAKLDSTPESLPNLGVVQLKNKGNDLDNREKMRRSRRLNVQSQERNHQVKEDDSDEEEDEEEEEEESESEESGSSSSSSGSSSRSRTDENEKEWDGDADFGGGSEQESDNEEYEQVKVNGKKRKLKEGEVEMPTNHWDWLYPDFLPATQCEVCHESFESITGVEKHRVVFHNLSNFVRCQGCGQTYTSFGTALKHRRKAKQGSSCYLKDIKSFQPQSYSEFPKYSGLGATKFCPQQGCYEIFAFDEHLTIHLKTHGSWSCQHCCEAFQKAHQLAWHELTLHNENSPADEQTSSNSEKQYKCSRCKFQNSFPKGILYHFMSEHLGISSTVESSSACVQCPICKRGFNASTSKKDIAQHIQAEHNVDGIEPDKLHKCDICQAPFRLQKSLTLHMKSVHKTNRDFPCSECGKIFRESRYLRRHLRLMHKESDKILMGKYECDICLEKFTRPTLLETHRKSHENGGQGYTCQQCDATFTKKATMRRHVLNKHRAPRFCCDTCGKLFPTQGKLTEHIKTHANRSPQQRNVSQVPQDNNAFICDLCGNTFRQAAKLRMHIRKVHETEAASAVGTDDGDMKFAPMFNYY